MRILIAWNTSIAPSTMAMMATVKVSTAIEVNGETMSAMPASMPMIPENSIQPRVGMAASEAAVAVVMMPRRSQPKPIHRAIDFRSPV